MKLSITVKKDGFRRAGRAWHGTSVIDSADFSDQQLQALHDDAMFSVEKAGATALADDDDATLIGQIAAAIAQLDSANPEHFTKSNKPEIKALEAIVGVNISAKQRDAAMQLADAI